MARTGGRKRGIRKGDQRINADTLTSSMDKDSLIDEGPGTPGILSRALSGRRKCPGKRKSTDSCPGLHYHSPHIIQLTSEKSMAVTFTIHSSSLDAQLND